MAESEKILSGSPFTASGVALAAPADFTTAKLIATSGGPCVVKLFDDTDLKYVLEAAPGAPDQYHGSANRKLTFKRSVQVQFVSGTGELYLYFT